MTEEVDKNINQASHTINKTFLRLLSAKNKHKW